MVRNSGAVAFAVLVVLLIASICSWAIMLSKWGRFRRARRQGQNFLRAFRKSGRLSEIAALVGNFQPSPLVSVFNEINDEYQRQSGGRGTPRNPIALERAAQTASSEALTAMESNMTWLATIANGATFVGLFGTVWGIIDAFHGLGTSGAATLRSVAPASLKPSSQPLQAWPSLYPRWWATTNSPPSCATSPLVWTTSDANCSMPSRMQLYWRRRRQIAPLRSPVRGHFSHGLLHQKRRPDSHPDPLADINITPLVDVVLVLLIIFMLTAPVLQSGIVVAVPHTRTVTQLTEQRTVVTIDKNQNVYLQTGGPDQPVNLSELTTQLRNNGRDDSAKRVIYLRADEKVPFGAFASVMDAVKRAGITNISIVTQPVESSPATDNASK